MGEALISRSGGGGSDDDSSIVVIPTHHSVLVTVKGPGNNGLAVNYPVNCKDGSVYYNYVTNSKGQVLFMCNSGTANILTSNYVGGIHYVDTSNKWTNIGAPVGQSTKLNIELAKGKTSYVVSTAYNFTTAVSRKINIGLIGGGGGGGCGRLNSSADCEYHGGGGGAGYLNWYNNYSIEGCNIYRFHPGSGGTRVNRADRENGGSGGTSYIENTTMSAIGGSGGKSWTYSNNGGIGGLGNGANGGRWPGTAGNSPVSFAGGGGAAGGGTPGSPYGGTCPYDQSTTRAGLGGGGGGSGRGPGSSDYTTSGYGGNGGMVINITY